MALVVKNSEIRRRAWALCKKNYGLILGVSLIVSIINSLPVLLSEMPLGGIVAGDTISVETVAAAISVSGMISFLFAVFSDTVLASGMIYISMRIWHNRPASVGNLFHHARRFWRLLGIMVLASLTEIGLAFAILIPFFILLFAISVFAAAVGGTGTLFFTLLSAASAIAAWVFIIAFSLRLSLAMPTFVIDPDTTASRCVSISWRRSKRRVKRIFCQQLALSWPIFVGAAMMLGFRLTANPIAMIVFELFCALFNGYISIGQFGLAEYILTDSFPEGDLPSEIPGLTGEFSRIESSSAENIPEADPPAALPASDAQEEEKPSAKKAESEWDEWEN